MNRRRFLRCAGALALSPTSSLRAQTPSLRFADMHSHLGLLRGAANVREAMTQNGMLAIARKIVADLPEIRSLPGGSIQQFREPAAGQLAQAFDATLAQMRAQHKREGLGEIVSVEALDRVVAERTPAAVIAAEGGDFIDGKMERLETARAQGLTHLQLVHYRISEIGDISTERPVHNGLTAFGKEVVSACNRLGILIDVAHGTSAVIEQTLELSKKPIIYSHGHVSAAQPYFTQNGARARAIHKPLALRIAQGGGVIGLWPLGSQYRTVDAYADALVEAAQSLGAEHVGVGSDCNGLPSTVLPTYAEFATLPALLAKRGLKSDEAEAILGNNYLRVLRQALAG